MYTKRGEGPTERASVTCQLTGRELMEGRREKVNNLATKLQLYEETISIPIQDYISPVKLLSKNLQFNGEIKEDQQQF